MRKDLQRYWRRRGLRYYREFELASESTLEIFANQETALRHSLLSLPRSPTSVLELGCGFGRITAVLREAFPTARIVAYDLSSSQIQRAKRRVKRVEFCVADVTDLELSIWFDLTIACEFYMHLPEGDFEIVMDKVARLTRHFAVNIDFGGPLPKQAFEYQFVHDYENAYLRRGFQILESKSLAKGQVLLVAARPPVSEPD